MGATLPDPAAVLEGATLRAWATVEFGMAASEQAVSRFTKNERDAVDLGIVAGITAAVEELHSRGLLLEVTQ